MTNQNVTTPATIKSIEVVYTVADKRKDARVSVTSTGGYSCSCGVFALYGECNHSEAVQVARKAEGRKF